MAITKEELQKRVDKLLPRCHGYAQVFDSSYPDCLVTHIEVGTSAYLDVNESLSRVPGRMILAFEDIKVLIDHSIAMIRENEKECLVILESETETIQGE